MSTCFDCRYSIKEVLLELCSTVDTTLKKNVCNIHREDVMDGALRAFTRKSFQPKALLDVKFIGEDGYDEGGPLREFMRLALRAIAELPIFEGPESSRQLTLDYKCKEIYYCL